MRRLEMLTVLQLLLVRSGLAAPQLLFEYPNVSSDAKACRCVAPQDCLNGSGFFFRYVSSSTGFGFEKMCEKHGDICCALASVTKRERLPATRENPPVSKKCHNCNTDNKLDKVIGKCGIRNPKGVDPTDLVERRGEAKFGEFPWMVALLGKSKPNERGQSSLIFAGGGSLVHPKAVVTAAHCVFDRYSADRLTIRAGEWDPRERKEYLPHRHRDARRIIVHEDYREDRGNDYAIVILKTPFELAPHIGLACLPDRMTNFEPSRCLSTGWGRKPLAQGLDEKKILKKVELPLVPNEACVDMYRNFGSLDFSLHASYLCAGGEYGKDTCNHDSGGPLVCPLLDEPTRYVQVGIVSAGPSDCGTQGLPGIYSDLTFARKWILRKLADNDIYIDNNAMPS